MADPLDQYGRRRDGDPLSAYSAPVSEFTTPADRQREVMSRPFPRGFGRDVGPQAGPGSWWEPARAMLERIFYNPGIVQGMRSPVAAPRVNAIQAEHTALRNQLANEYTRLMGGGGGDAAALARDMSTPALRRWVDLMTRAETQLNRPPPSAVGPAPVAGEHVPSPYYANIPPIPPPNRLIGRSGAIIDNPRVPQAQRDAMAREAQGLRDLYELTPATNPHEARAMMMDVNHRSMLDPVRSQRFWDADFENAVPPPRGKMHADGGSVGPLAQYAPGGVVSMPERDGAAISGDWWSRVRPQLQQVPKPLIYPESQWQPRTPDYETPYTRQYTPDDFVGTQLFIQENPPVQDELGHMRRPAPREPMPYPGRDQPYRWWGWRNTPEKPR